MPKAPRSTPSETPQEASSTSSKVWSSVGRAESETARAAGSTGSSRVGRTFPNRQTSCNACKIRKVKCSRQLPCSNCSMRSEDCVYPGIAPQERADTLSAARMEVERLTEVVETLQSKLNEERADSDEEEIEPIPFIGAEEGYSTSAPSTNVAPYPLPPHTLGRSSYLTTGAAYHRPTIPSQQPPTPAASSVFSYESFQSASYPHPAPHPPAPQTSLYPPHFPSYYPSPSFHSPPPSFHPLARPPPTQPQFHYALLPAPSSALSTPNQRLPTPYIPPPSLPVAHAPPLPGEEASPRRPAREAREGKEEEVWSWCSEEVGELERAVEEMGRREGGGR